jgi:hypothetical protein
VNEKDLKPCAHLGFHAHVDVNRFEEEGRFIADVRIECTACKKKFRFLGLPGGIDLNGASTNAFGDEAHLAIAPPNEVIPPIAGAQGFSMRGIGFDAPVGLSREQVEAILEKSFRAGHKAGWKDTRTIFGHHQGLESDAWEHYASRNGFCARHVQGQGRGVG